MLDGQRVVVLGGSSGIGLATARCCARAGAVVTIVARDEGKLAEAAASVPGGRWHAADARSRPALDAFFAGFGSFDHLVLSVATGGGAGDFRTLDLAVLRAAIEGKLLAYLQALQAALPQLRGSVVMLAAASARMGAPGTTGLAASNGAVTAATAPLAAELAPVRVNTVCPGIVETPIFERWPEALRASFAERAIRAPVGRAGRPEEIAQAVLFCLANGFVTGAVIDCDGGMRLRH